jgi:ATP-dependent DNA helicase UvrD/PcrA
MPTWNDNLTGVHLEIAAETGTPIHVLAGPGTGKTFAMMRRVARLLEEGVDPKAILTLSFTRTAATDLESQLAKLGTTGASKVRASTLHSLCFSLLSQAAVFPHTNRVARPLLSYEVRFLELDLDKFGGLKAVRELLEAYEAAWARLQTDIPGGPSSQIDVAFHAAVLQWLTYHRSMLIGELVPLTIRFASQNPASTLLPSFEHVLVDEFQDLNKAEQALIEKLATGASLTVIGDDCQSIYRFRYAHPEGIRAFPKTHPGTVAKSILDSRRCPPNIAAMSNSLIANEPARTRKVPLTPNSNRANADVFVVQHDTLEEEVKAVSTYVDAYLAKHPSLPAGQVLVLTPRRFIGNRIRDLLIDRGRNAMSYFTEDPVQEPAAARGMALLTLMVDPSDRAALRAWLGMESDTGLRGGYRHVVAAAQAAVVEPREMLARLETGTVKIPHTSAVVQRWKELNAALAPLATLKGLDLVRAIWPQANESCDDIRLMAEAVAVRVSDAPQILEELRQDITQPYLPDSESDVIRIMSLHKSKGLTASLVVVAGAMAGALPTIDARLPKAEQDAQYLEQRRLFYVAITRATDTLLISAPMLVPFAQAMQAGVTVVQTRWLGGQRYSVVAMSPFVAELGLSCPPTITGMAWRSTVGI